MWIVTGNNQFSILKPTFGNLPTIVHERSQYSFQSLKFSTSKAQNEFGHSNCWKSEPADRTVETNTFGPFGQDAFPVVKLSYRPSCLAWSIPHFEKRNAVTWQHPEWVLLLLWWWCESLNTFLSILMGILYNSSIVTGYFTSSQRDKKETFSKYPKRGQAIQ